MLKRGFVHLVLGAAMLASSGISAVAAPISGLGITTTDKNLPVEQVYFYHGHYYRYYWHGHYYPYHWQGHYYPYRWHGGYYNYYWHGRYYNHRAWRGGVWVYW